MRSGLLEFRAEVDERLAYFNQAGTSWPKPGAVQAAAAAALGADCASWAGEFEAQHRRVARAFGVTDPSRLLLTPGCTSALAVAVADHDWQSGERVLTSALEHHALARPVEALRARGVEVGALPRAANAPLDLDALRDELRRGGVRLVALTAACNVTGELLPVREALGLAHEHGALCLIDGAQVAGWTDLDLVELGVDLFAFAGHKALHAPWGIGGLYVAPDVVMTSPAATCALPQPGEDPQPAACASMPGYCDVGSVDRAALAGLAAALDWLEARPDRLELGRARIERITFALEERGDARLLGVRPPDERLPTVAFTLAGWSVAELALRFHAAGVVVAAGFQCAPLAHAALGTASEGALRLSAGPGNETNDVERVLEVLAGLERRG